MPKHCFKILESSKNWLSYLIKHEPDIGLLSQHSAKISHDLQAQGFIASRIIASMNIYLNLLRRNSLYLYMYSITFSFTALFYFISLRLHPTPKMRYKTIGDFSSKLPTCTIKPLCFYRIQIVWRNPNTSTCIDYTYMYSYNLEIPVHKHSYNQRYTNYNLLVVHCLINSTYV